MIYSAHLLLLLAAVPWVVVDRSWIPCAVAQILRYIILYPAAVQLFCGWRPSPWLPPRVRDRRSS